MSTPAHADETATGPDVRPSPLVLRTFGEPKFHTDGEVAAVAFAADGSVRSIDETGALMHWSADGRLLKRMYLSDLETAWCFDPTDRLLASCNDDLLFWDVAEGQLLHRIKQQSWVTAMGFAADGAVMATGHDDGTVRFWDTRSFASLGEIAAHKMPVSAITFSPTGTMVATAGEDRIVRVWDADSHKPLAKLASHTDRIPALAWSADGSLLVSAGWDTSARVWDPTQAEPLILLNSHADQVMALVYNPVENQVATADSDHDVHLWSDPASGQPGQVLRGHVDEIRTLAYSPDGSHLISGGADRVIHLWDVATGERLAGPNPRGQHPIAVFRTNDQLFLASGGSSAFHLWNVATAAEVTPADAGPAHAIAADTTGRWLAVGGTDAFIRLYDLTADNAPPRLLEATKPPIGAVAFSPTGNYLAHASPADGLVWLWNPADTSSDAALILIEAADGCTLEGLAFHPDGNRVAVGGIDYLSTGDRDGAVCVWDVTTKKKTVTFDVGVYAVAIDPTGRYMAGAGVTDQVYVWDLTTNEQVFELDGHTDRLYAVAFSPDGSYLLTGGEDMTVRVWDLLSGRLMVARAFDSAVQALAFSPDGRHLFIGNGNTTCSQLEFARLIDE